MCMTRRGGFFLPNVSETYQNDTDPVPVSFGGPIATPTNTIWDPTETLRLAGYPNFIGSDKIILNENVLVPQFPFGVLQKGLDISNEYGITDQASFGLGGNSSILTALKQAGTIGSTSFGYLWGLDGATDAARMDGSLILGGYDQAKIKNPNKNHTGNLSTKDSTLCPQHMTLTINEVRLNFPNGSEPNLLVEGPVTTCICLHANNILSLPYDPYYERFEAWTDAVSINRNHGISLGDELYRVDEAYQGDLTLVLDSGLAIRIQNNQLALPELKIGEDGKMKANASVRSMMLSSQTWLEERPCVGRAFFTGAYMHVDNERESFTIWEANATTDKNLVSVTDAGVQAACPASTSRVQVPLSTSDGNSSSGIGSNAGAIAGLVILVLAAIGMIGFVVYTAKAKTRPKAENPSRDGGDSKWEKGELEDTMRVPVPELPGSDPSEMVGDPLPPQELWAGRRIYKPNVHELPGSTA
ncbi:hypothetical protein BCR34DRAFT_631499 [Clohesyomyces aquaticus]|uniref:Aspartic peptidase domain-containing protein n=1 Tax=Clohesyomyces aquaticus TaxID=1231657 RepID=A0A1Y2A6D9_9PLEO|nr:hypothetical protein BCR34DRAFT_631499 [Clohesyomyces aquaticus]